MPPVLLAALRRAVVVLLVVAALLGAAPGAEAAGPPALERTAVSSAVPGPVGEEQSDEAAPAPPVSARASRPAPGARSVRVAPRPVVRGPGGPGLVRPSSLDAVRCVVLRC
ncbi:hypothetical protein [Streptomyces melanogenes]|uniref:hypothetical protein n=1 Tax=Streptomyces melanogenes TaxID=67326 RepID=UPI00167E4125|nr:hypothetical protein [Streptomyces melanogenes]GGP58374.1 hypothetical protein GCM10010278_39170 [Streptomyces melanogenes]